MQMACQGKLGKMPRNLMEMNALKKIEKLSPLLACDFLVDSLVLVDTLL